tara:strand:- start:146 stop:349 length:204 start_codon:yes stop_codon:yes gene_type:complete
MKTKTNLKEFLKQDLTKLEYHTQQIIQNLYARGQQDNFKKDIEQIEGILIYWNYHIKSICPDKTTIK